MAILGLVVPLVLVIYEDFTSRSIHWYWIALMILLALFASPWQVPYLLVNLLLVVFQLALLTLYFSFKHGKVVNILDRYLGLGDVLFLIPMGILFSPGNFISFFMLSLMLSLASHLMLQVCFLPGPKTIPLAGYMALTLLLLLAARFLLGWDWQDDSWIKNMLSSWY